MHNLNTETEITCDSRSSLIELFEIYEELLTYENALDLMKNKKKDKKWLRNKNSNWSNVTSKSEKSGYAVY